MSDELLGPGLGLSPLARGTPLYKGDKVILSRFIPAGAGNTITGWRFRGDPTVYPRWRGEHTARLPKSVVALGLSPLARGTL